MRKCKGCEEREKDIKRWEGKGWLQGEWRKEVDMDVKGGYETKLELMGMGREESKEM